MLKFITLSQLEMLAGKIKALFVVKEPGKGLSENDLSNGLKSSYDAAVTHSQASHAPAGAQANVLESVKVNGAALTITGKAADIPVLKKVSEMTNDRSFQTSSQVSASITSALTPYAKSADLSKM